MARRKIWKWVRRTLLAALLIVLVVAAYFAHQAIVISTAYSAKTLCSAVFISQRPEESVVREDLEWFTLLTHEVDLEQQTTASSLKGWWRREALFREGLGCTLLIGATREQLLAQVEGFQPGPPVQTAALDAPWPRGERVDPEAHFRPDLAAQVELLLDATLAEAEPDAPERTRALVVVQRGRVLAEAYAPGFGAETPLAGWSMAKSVTNALVGIMVSRKVLSVQPQAPVPEWPPHDRRSAIRLDQLLRMTSGLYFQEFYFGPTTATRMLFASANTGAYAASQTLREEPGERWYYSSGNSNIVSRIIRYRLGGSQADYFSFPRRALFDPLHMRSAVMEPDASGTFVGSSFLFATARDWARFGLLYLQDGVWEGRRILPEGWVAYSTEVTPLSPKGRYGAHWWLNRGEPPDSPNRIWPGLPSDAYFASGFEGQYLMVIPSRELVLVRLGLTHPPASFDVGRWAGRVLELLPDQGQSSEVGD